VWLLASTFSPAALAICSIAADTIGGAYGTSIQKDQCMDKLLDVGMNKKELDNKSSTTLVYAAYAPVSPLLIVIFGGLVVLFVVLAMPLIRTSVYGGCAPTLNAFASADGIGIGLTMGYAYSPAPRFAVLTRSTRYGTSSKLGSRGQPHIPTRRDGHLCSTATGVITLMRGGTNQD
ncbi:hypothetical protein H0E87_029733, partial [Populus deltoides]